MNEYRDLVDVPLILVNTSFSHPVSISQVLRPTKVIPNSMAPPRLAPPTLGFYASPSVGWPHAGESVSSQLTAKESNGKAESIMDQQATKQPGIDHKATQCVTANNNANLRVRKDEGRSAPAQPRPTAELAQRRCSGVSHQRRLRKLGPRPHHDVHHRSLSRYGIPR